MKTQLNLLRLGGVGHILFTVFHIFFRPIVGLTDKLEPLTGEDGDFINATLDTSTMFVALTMAIIAYLSLHWTQDLLTTPLGHALCRSVAVLWFGRAVMQVVYYGLDGPGIPIIIISIVLAALYVAPLRTGEAVAAPGST